MSRVSLRIINYGEIDINRPSIDLNTTSIDINRGSMKTTGART